MRGSFAESTWPNVVLFWVVTRSFMSKLLVTLTLLRFTNLESPGQGCRGY